jgi:hypothetical protein
VPVSLGIPFPEYAMIDSRRLLLVALLTIAPLVAACHTPTGNDNNDPTPPPPADTTGRKDLKPWG